MASAVLGKVSPTPKGEYVSTQDYDRLDVVTYDGYPYLAKSNVPSGNLPTDELYWMPLLTGLDFAPGGYGLGEQTSNLIDNNTLLSSVTKGGMYYWPSYNTDPDKPFNAGELLVIPRAGAGYFDQIAFGKDSTVPKVKIRQCLNVGSWSAWEDWSPSAFAPSGYGYGGSVPYVSVSDMWTDSSYNTALNGLLSGMADGEAKQIRIPFIDGTTTLGTVYRAADGYATVVCYGYGSYGFIARKNKYNGYWTDWEWENPPMSLGAEYKTTERYQGNPVYCKLVDCGAMPNSTLKTVYHKCGATHIVRYSAEMKAGAKVFSLPYTLNGVEVCVRTVSDGAISLDSSYNASGFNGYVTIWYTKG